MPKFLVLLLLPILTVPTAVAYVTNGVVLEKTSADATHSIILIGIRHRPPGAAAPHKAIAAVEAQHVALLKKRTKHMSVLLETVTRATKMELLEQNLALFRAECVLRQGTECLRPAADFISPEDDNILDLLADGFANHPQVTFIDPRQRLDATEEFLAALLEQLPRLSQHLNALQDFLKSTISVGDLLDRAEQDLRFMQANHHAFLARVKDQPTRARSHAYAQSLAIRHDNWRALRAHLLNVASPGDPFITVCAQRLLQGDTRLLEQLGRLTPPNDTLQAIDEAILSHLAGGSQVIITGKLHVARMKSILMREGFLVRLSLDATCAVAHSGLCPPDQVLPLELEAIERLLDGQIHNHHQEL